MSASSRARAHWLVVVLTLLVASVLAIPSASPAVAATPAGTIAPAAPALPALPTLPAQTAEQAPTSLPEGCVEDPTTVTCEWSGNVAIELPVPAGAQMVEFDITGSGGQTSGVPGQPTTGFSGYGGNVRGILRDAPGRTVYIGTAALGQDLQLTKYGDFNGGSGGCSYATNPPACGGRGGAASVIGVDDTLVAVAGGGGGQGGGWIADNLMYVGQKGFNAWEPGPSATGTRGANGAESAVTGGGGGGGGGATAGRGGAVEDGTGSFTAVPGLGGSAGLSTPGYDVGVDFDHTGDGTAWVRWGKASPTITIEPAFDGDTTVYAYSDPLQFPQVVTASTGIYVDSPLYRPTGTVTWEVGSATGAMPGPGITPGFEGCVDTLVNGEATCSLGKDFFPTPGVFRGVTTYSGDTGTQVKSFDWTVRVEKAPVQVAFESARNRDGTYTIKAFARPGVDKGVVDGTIRLSSTSLGSTLTDACPNRTSQPPSVALRNVALVLQCTLAAPPGAHDITVDFVGGRVSADASSTFTLDAAQFDPTVNLSLSQSVLPRPGSSVTATVQVRRPSTAPAAPTGTVEIAPESGTGPSCTATATGTNGLLTTFSCRLTPPTGATKYVARFAGDSTFRAASSAPVMVTTISGAATLSVTPAVSTVSAGETVSLAVAVSGLDGAPATAGTVKVYDGDPTADDRNLVGTIDLAASPGGGTVVATPSAENLTHTYTARFTDSTSQLRRATATSGPVIVTPMRSSGVVTAAPNGRITAAGVPVTVTATFTVAADDRIDADITMPAGSRSCGPTTRTISGNDRVLTRTCSYVVAPGAQPTFEATYSDRLVGSLSASLTTFTAAVSPTQIELLPTASVTYGTSPQFAANIRSIVASTPISGTIEFVVAGAVLCSADVTLVGEVHTATCSPTNPVAAGTRQVSARYVPGDVAPAVTAASRSKAAPFTVTPEVVNITMRTARTGRNLSVLATALPGAGNEDGPLASGSIVFTAGAASCRTVVLNAGVATCTIPQPAPGAAVTISASYKASANFVAGPKGSASLRYRTPAAGACQGGFAALAGNLIRRGVGGSIRLDAGQMGQASLQLSEAVSACDASDAIKLRANVNLFGGLIVADNLAATITADRGLCLLSGRVSLPSVWKSGSLAITAAICFPLTATGGISAPSTGALALRTGGTARLPLISIPGVAGNATLSARFGSACGTGVVGSSGCAIKHAAVTIAASTAPQPGGIPGVTVIATVGANGKLHADVSSTPLQALGASWTLAGSLSRENSAAPLSGSVTATLDDDASPAEGLTLAKGMTLSVEAMTGSDPSFSVNGSATIGADTPRPIEVAVTGSFTSTDNYSLAVTSTTTGTWTPVEGLDITPNLTGSLSRADGTTSWEVTASGTEDQPLATWDAGDGVTVVVDKVSLGADPTLIDENCKLEGVVLALAGSVTVEDLKVDTTGCIALGDQGWHLSASASGDITYRGVTLTDPSFEVTKPKDGKVSIAGSSTLVINIGDDTLRAVVTISREDDVLVIGGDVDATGLGIPGATGYVAYASADVADWDTGVPTIGSGGKVDLTAGFTVFGAAEPPASVVDALAEVDIDLSSSVLTFSAEIPEGADELTLRATLATPSSLPIIELPGGSRVDSLALSYSKGTYGLTAKGAVSGQDGSLAPAEINISFTSSDDFSGSATVTGLSLFGATLDLEGSLTRVDGVTTSTVSGKVLTPIQIGGATLENVTVTLGTEGLGATGDVSVASTRVAFSAAFESTKSYSLDVSTTVENWKPVTGVDVSATFTGSLARTASGWTYRIEAKPLPGSSDLMTVEVGSNTSFALNSFIVSNGPVPTTCSLTNVKGSWLGVGATLRLDEDAVTGSASGSGCFDLKNGAFALDVSMPRLDLGGLGGKVRTSDTVIQVRRSADAKYTLSARTRVFVEMPGGGEFSALAVVTFGSDGFAIGCVADLSSFFVGRSSVRLFYASAPMDVDTGDSVLGTLSLKAGLTVGLDVEISRNVSAALDHVGVKVAPGSKLAATANLDFTTSTLKFIVKLDFAPTDIFSLKGGQRLTASKLYLQLTLSATQPSIGLELEGSLHLPAAVRGGSPSVVAVAGGISIGRELTAYVSVKNWNDAFGVEGLDVAELTLQGGITLVGVPLPSLALTARVTGLPDDWADTIGYRQGAPMSLSLAFSGSQFLLDIQIGSKGSTEPVLQPFASSGNADLLSVNYAQLYISPTGATIGGTVHRAGIFLEFDGVIGGAKVHVEARVDPVKMQLYFRGDVGRVTIGSVTIGPTMLTIDVSPTSFQVDFKGALQIGPVAGEVLGLFRYDLQNVSADVELSIGTSRIAAKANISVTGTVGVRIPFCCWADSDISFTLTNLGFEIDGRGLTVLVPNSGYSVTLPWPGRSSSSSAVALTTQLGPADAVPTISWPEPTFWSAASERLAS